MTWRAQVLTIFPEMFPGPLAESLSGKALTAGLWSLEAIDIRAFAGDKHGSVDDSPYGGGAGMIMRPDVVDAALQSASVDHELPIIYLTPRGAPLTQSALRRLSLGPGACVVCGRYEGIDQRVVDAWRIEEYSLGDYVLSGGELPAMCVLDGCVRLLPGVVGDSDSLIEESFEDGLLEYPHYTRPSVWRDRSGVERAVPDVLLSGDHDRIARWRRAQAEQVTRQRRPDLWAAAMARGPSMEKDHRP